MAFVLSSAMALRLTSKWLERFLLPLVYLWDCILQQGPSTHPTKSGWSHFYGTKGDGKHLQMARVQCYWRGGLQICILLGLHHHPKEQSMDCRRRRLGDVEKEVATTAETSRACSPGSKIIMAICSFSVSIILWEKKLIKLLMWTCDHGCKSASIHQQFLNSFPHSNKSTCYHVSKICLYFT